MWWEHQSATFIVTTICQLHCFKHMVNKQLQLQCTIVCCTTSMPDYHVAVLRRWCTTLQFHLDYAVLPNPILYFHDECYPDAVLLGRCFLPYTMVHYPDECYPEAVLLWWCITLVLLGPGHIYSTYTYIKSPNPSWSLSSSLLPFPPLLCFFTLLPCCKSK